MKIHQLPIGARFEYEGQEYVKTAPLFATGAAGQRLIPKYAVLTPLGEVAGSPAAQPGKPIARAAVVQAFDAFYAQCKAWVADDRQTALDLARERFLKALDE